MYIPSNTAILQILVSSSLNSHNSLLNDFSALPELDTSSPGQSSNFSLSCSTTFKTCMVFLNSKFYVLTKHSLIYPKSTVITLHFFLTILCSLFPFPRLSNNASCTMKLSLTLLARNHVTLL